MAGNRLQIWFRARCGLLRLLLGWFGCLALPLAQQHAQHNKQRTAVLGLKQFFVQQGNAKQQGKNGNEVGIGSGAPGREPLYTKVVQAVSGKGNNTAKILQARPGSPVGKGSAKVHKGIWLWNCQGQQTKKDHAHK